MRAASIVLRRWSPAPTPSRRSCKASRRSRIAKCRSFQTPKRRSDFSLDVGGLTETVDVTAQAEAVTLNKTNGSIGQTFTARQASELPLPARNPVNLALLAPNVTSSVGQTAISANGQRSRNNNFMIDGTDNNDVSVTLPTVPVPPDSVSEFNVQTNPYNAEFGRNSGAQINIITKSGSNDFRGSAFDFYSDSDLNARDNLEKQSGASEAHALRAASVGRGAGGPIVRNKAFFYGLFQNTRLRRDVLGATTRVITPKSGFAALQNVPLGAGQTAASRPGGARPARVPPGRIRAGRRVSGTSRTSPVNGVPIETGQVNVSRVGPADDWYYIGRGDVEVSQNNISGRYIRRKRDDTNFTSNTAFGPAFAANQLTTDQNMSFGGTRVFGASMLNEARFASIKRDLSSPRTIRTRRGDNRRALHDSAATTTSPRAACRAPIVPGHPDDAAWTRLPQGGRGHPLRRPRQPRSVRYEGHVHLQQPAGLHEQLRDDLRAGAPDRQLRRDPVEPVVLHSGRLAADLEPDDRPWIALQNSTVPLGLFGAEDPQVQRRARSGSGARDNNDWAPRVGFACSPRP